MKRLLPVLFLIVAATAHAQFGPVGGGSVRNLNQIPTRNFSDLQNVPASTNAIYVSQSQGSDTPLNLPTAGSFMAPYKTLSEAKAAATSGQTIVVLDGSFSDTTLLKNGVNWYFAPGVSVANTSATLAIWHNTAVHGDPAVTSVITGAASFTDSNGGGIVNMKQTGSNVAITCYSMASTSTPVFSGSDGATLYVRASTIANTSATSSAAVWWEAGLTFIESDYISAVANAAVYSDGTSSVTDGRFFWVRAKYIVNTGTGSTKKGVWANDNFSNLREWVEALEIQAPIAVYQTGSSLMYVKAEKIFGQLGVTQGTLYADAQKLSDDGLNSTGGLISITGGTCWLNISQIDDAALAASQAAVQVSGGTAYLACRSLTRATTGNGVSVSGGTLTLSGTTVSTQGGSTDLVQTAGTFNVLACKYTSTSGTITFAEPRVANALQSGNNLSDVANAATARANIGANNASNLTTGIVAQAQLGSGSTGAGTKFLADDQAYHTLAGGGSVSTVTPANSAGTFSPLFTYGFGANNTTTPALSFTLSNAGAHNFFGNNTGGSAAPAYVQPAFSDLSGSVAAAQMPALTGDVTSSAGTVATTIAANAVTYSKFQQVAAKSLVGNATGAGANATGITLDGGMSFSGTVLRGYGPTQALGAYAIDVSTGKSFSKTLAAGVNTFTWSNFNDGDTISVRLKQVPSGSVGTVVFPTTGCSGAGTTIWQSGSQPVQTATFNASDRYIFQCDGNDAYGFASQNYH